MRWPNHLDLFLSCSIFVATWLFEDDALEHSVVAILLQLARFVSVAREKGVPKMRYALIA